ncbi:hypothetical protein N7470_004042 [Penicillium chermesinum]|nr:hypothetical protein N7470_004042 [Penicillium chermesinum]
MAITTNNLKVIYGGAAFNTSYGSNPETVTEVLQFLRREGITSIDSGQAYGDSESLLGRAKAASLGFSLDTKVAGGLWPHVNHTKDVVIKAGEDSVKALGKVPVKETLEGINELYRAGKFKRFGLSNFNPAETAEVIRIAEENAFVLPTVYQGNYNAAGRLAEKELLPLLRKHNIAFYAYSPIAGGYLTKTPEDINSGKGRFSRDLPAFGAMYNSLYNTPKKLSFLTEFGKIASENSISQAELGYRWVAYHSALTPENGDGIIIGSRLGAQLTNTLNWLKKGPLSAEAAQKVNDLSKIIEGEEILDNWNDYISKKR